jgi:WD40 repeat protein
LEGCWSPSEEVVVLPDRLLLRTITPGGWLSCIGISSDAGRCVSATTAGLAAWDLEGGKLRFARNCGGGARCASVSPNGRWALFGTESALLLWDIETDKEFRTITDKNVATADVAFNKESSIFASISVDGLVRAWSVREQKPLASFVTETTPTSCSFDSDLEMIVGDGRGTVHFLQLEL